MTKPTPDQVEKFLPDPPDGFHYSVEQVSPLVMKVWLHHHKVYDYNLGEPVKTIYCFIKQDKVYPPKSCEKMRPESLCPLTDLWRQPSYTTIIPTTTDLTHLL